jgi:threonyl-tRNA synthetase
MHVQDAMLRTWQLGTIQLDFVLPERFDLKYDAADGSKKTPVMLHRAVLGSIERFIAILLEHKQGKLPIDFAPVQVVVCSIVSDCADYAQDLTKKLKSIGIEAEFDIRNVTLGYKVREHKTKKVPIIAVVGKQEVEKNEFVFDCQGQKTVFSLNNLDAVKEFMKKLS